MDFPLYHSFCVHLFLCLGAIQTMQVEKFFPIALSNALHCFVVRVFVGTHTHNIWWYGDGVVQLNFFLVDLRVVFVYMLLLNWLFLQFAQIRSNSRAAPYEWKIETNAKQLLFHGLALFGCSWMGNDCYWLDLAWVSRNARKVSAIWNVCIEKFEEVYYIIQLHTQAHAADP